MNEANQTDTATQAAAMCHKALSRFLRHPDKLIVKAKAEAGALAVVADPHEDDWGAVVGKKSIRAWAMKVLLAQFGAKHKHVAVYQVAPARRDSKAGLRPPPTGKDWVPAEFECYVWDLLVELLHEEPRLDYDHDEAKGRTRVWVWMADAEPKHVADGDLLDALSRVLNAAGAAVGRKVYVERMERGKPAEVAK